MSDPRHHDEPQNVIDNVEHSIISHSQPPLLLKTDQLLTPWWARVILKLGDSRFDPIMSLRGKPSKVTPCGGEKGNGIGTQREAGLLRRK